MKTTSTLLRGLLVAALALAVGAILTFVIGLPVPTPSIPSSLSPPTSPLAGLSHEENVSAESPAESLPPGSAAPMEHPAESAPRPTAASTPLPRTRGSPAPAADARGGTATRSAGRPGRVGHPAGPVAATADGTALTVQTFQRDPGVQVPVSFVSLDEVSLSEPQARKLHEMATGFLQAVEASPDVSAAWQAERARADERFKTLYGRDLYMRQMLNAAREARGVPMLPAP